MRHAARIALAAFLFSALTFAPLGLRAHVAGSSANFHPDFCTSVPADHAEPASLPATPEHEPSAGTHCSDCAGCAGGVVAQPASVTPWLAIAPAADRIVVKQPPATVPHDELVARPRGPPLPA